MGVHHPRQPVQRDPPVLLEQAHDFEDRLSAHDTSVLMTSWQVLGAHRVVTAAWSRSRTNARIDSGADQPDPATQLEQPHHEHLGVGHRYRQPELMGVIVVG